jgi:ATP-dependent DNA helicase PIF1
VAGRKSNFSSKKLDVNELNLKIQNLLPGDLGSYKSIDTVCDPTEVVNYPTEFLNSCHRIVYNWRFNLRLFYFVIGPTTVVQRHAISHKKSMKNVIEVIILNGKFWGENILLPRIPIIPTDMPIQFKRLQFPIRLAFAMTINKSQGQTMFVCGLDSSTSYFSQGQLYVACSRIIQFVLAKDGITKNIVHSVTLRDRYCFLLILS